MGKKCGVDSNEERRVKWREKSKGPKSGKITLEKYVGKQSMMRRWKGACLVLSRLGEMSRYWIRY